MLWLMCDVKIWDDRVAYQRAYVERATRETGNCYRRCSAVLEWGKRGRREAREATTHGAAWDF